MRTKTKQKHLANGCICIAEGANMPTTPEAVLVFKMLNYSLQEKHLMLVELLSGLEMSQNSLRLSWSAEEVDEKLKESCLLFTLHVWNMVRMPGYVDYVKGANIAGFVKVADAMLAQGVV
jgi:glutamate dehydrogenase (NADP+)